MVKNPPSNAGDMGNIPGWGTKTPHAVEKQSPCTATTEPVRHNQRVHGQQPEMPSDTRPDAAKWINSWITFKGFPDGTVVKNPPANAGDTEMWVQSLGQEDPLV